MTGNELDIVFAVIITVSVVFGFFRGLLQAVFGILSLILAFYIAKSYGPIMFDTIFNLFGESTISVAIAYVFVFLIAFMLSSLIASVFRKALRKHVLGSIDNIGGFFFGFFRGLLYSIFLTVMLALTPLPNTKVWKESEVLPIISTAMQWLLTLPKIKEYRKYWSFNKNSPQIKLDKVLDMDFLKISRGTSVTRDDELDKLIEEGRRQSLHGNKEAEDISMQHYEKNKEDSPIQAINDFLQELLSDESTKGLANKNCKEGDKLECAE